ncbi:hypothetical protein GUJ93_ZPchr0013g37675 [Zizania palustris]|uniref:Uncharacterized protein n=1 Tax=Zizania palustris TaxID=103762 RepID=A0A8J5WVJ2_ZIZPA|nr:hypothetical protein GUJ93_ZPchr0013g37675 [Zizania palustris]
MAGMVGVWLGEFAKLGRGYAPAGDAVVGRRAQNDGTLQGESGKSCEGSGDVQETTTRRRRRRSSGVLSDSEATVCMLMDRFAPA